MFLNILYPSVPLYWTQGKLPLSVSGKKRKQGHSSWGASLLCSPFAWQRKKATLSFSSITLSPYFCLALVHREPRFWQQIGGLVWDWLVGRRPHRALGLMGRSGISLHASLSRESRGLEDFSEARLPGLPCHRAVPDHTRPAVSAAELQGCGRDRGRGCPRSCRGFLCLEDTFLFPSCISPDIYSEKTLTPGGSERGRLVRRNTSASNLVNAPECTPWPFWLCPFGELRFQFGEFSLWREIPFVRCHFGQRSQV